ncbi:hypothetical protein NE237_029155 [Protea cynaroides]|uniref:O-methyltransferase n=1 Tax=Protea cynaroides TaxID=273540 RepID=A0A9Q0JW04_9MAGN|nr:hypothetical protein NE237_029155 [Protea cynaroides]
MDLIEKESSKELLQAQAHLWNHIFCFINSMSLRCAVQLSIPDIVHNHHQPITLSELATKLAIPKTKTACLFRLMRLLVHSGFFAIQNEGYVLTPSSRLLLKDNTMSVLPFLQSMLDPILVTPWHSMSALFQENGLTPFEVTHGRNFWAYAAEDTELNKNFNEAMASDARLVMSIVVTEGKGVFEGLRSLVDVGGGTGTVAKTIAETFPTMKCAVFDLPHVIVTLDGNENLKYIAGDMFESIPHADAVLLKWILHDWNDEQCIKILKRSKEAISNGEKGGNLRKVIIVDMVVDDQKKVEPMFTQTQLFFDMLMMTSYNGRERTEKEWEKLFLESGFSHYKITRILGLRPEAPENKRNCKYQKGGEERRRCREECFWEREEAEIQAWEKSGFHSENLGLWLRWLTLYMPQSLAIETKSPVDDQQWLTYWVLYSMITLFELTFARVIEW